MVLGPHPILAQLTKEFIIANLDEIVDMSKQLRGDYWVLEHYLSELNRKWELSKALLTTDGKFAAFIIVSEKADSLHVHRIVVKKEYQGHGLGKMLMTFVKRSAQKLGKNKITLKAEADNPQSIGFYRGLNFEINGEQGALVLMTLNLSQ